MSKEVLAVVAGKEITNEDLEAFLVNVPKEQKAYISNPQFRQRYLEQLVELRLFAKYGEDEKLEETEEFKKVLENAKADILARMTIREAIKGEPVSEEEAKEFYEAHPEHFRKPETVRAKHILVDDEEKCKEIKKALDEGTQSFEDAATEFSSCPSKSNGGDLGEFGRGQMVKEFEDAAFAAELNVVTEPVQTQFGYHLIKVIEKHEASVADFETVKDVIFQNLGRMKEDERYTAKVKELKEKYDVTLN